MPNFQAREDLFKVELPKIFIPDVIKKRYEPYLFKLPTPIQNISDLVNYSIQSISIPNFNYSPVEQVLPGITKNRPYRGSTRSYRNSLSPEMLIDRKFSITFALMDGYLNYWIMLETFFHYYAFEQKELYTCDIPLRILDSDGYNLYSAIFKDCLFTGMNQFELSYSGIAPEFKTFECNFAFNNLLMDFQLQ